MREEPQDGAALWNDDAFRRRVALLAADRGMTIAALCRRAGLSASYLARPAGKSGRSVEALMGIARALDVSLIELTGSINLHDATPTDENLARLALIAEIAAYLYVALGSRPLVPHGGNTIDLVSMILRWLETNSPAD